MAKSRSGASRTVVKQEDNESNSRWIECKALLADIWKELPAVPCVESRRAWAVAHGVDPARVHAWFCAKKRVRTRKGILHHSEDGYALPLEVAPEEQPPSTSLNVVPALDAPSSPSYLPMSSPPPQTPMDAHYDLPVAISSGASFGEGQTVHPLASEMPHPKPRPVPYAPPIHPSKVDLAVKTEIVDAAPLSNQQAPENRKNRRIIIRIASDKEESSSNRPRKEPGSSKPTTATARSKKPRRAKKVPKTEAVDGEGRSSGPQEKSTPDAAGPMMAFPQNFPAGFCPPYFTYMNPAMAFGNGMTGAHNLPSHSFGNMMFNPFTGAPLFNNMPAQFSAFPGQPGQPPLFNGNADILYGQMASQTPAPALPGPSMNAPGFTPMDQNLFAGNFQGFQPGMPTGGVMNPQNPPEPTMSLIDFLNQPLDAGWTYP